MKVIIDVPIHPPGLAALTARGDFRIDCLASKEAQAPARAIDPARIGDAEALFCHNPPTNLEAMRQLRLIQIDSAGYKQLVNLGLAERSIHAANARGCFDIPVAEWNLGMMMMLARNVRQMIRNQEAAVWNAGAIFQQEIHGRTVGIWGYGGIGRETARLVRQLGLKVHVLTRSGVRPRRDTYLVPGTGDPEGVLPQRTFTAGEEKSFLSGLDYLVVSMPLTSATNGLIGERELHYLPPTAFVLNPARGPIIQEPALLRALREGWIAGAALDTHYKYPLPPDHPLWKMPNVIVTPHISGASLGPNFPDRIWNIFIENLGRLQTGQSLLNELTPAELAGQ